MSGFECGGVVVVYSGKSWGHGGLLGEEGGGFGGWHCEWFLGFVVVWKLCRSLTYGCTDVCNPYGIVICEREDITCGDIRTVRLLAKLYRQKDIFPFSRPFACRREMEKE